MAGKIIADTLETGAGADISTSYVVNGSAKAWLNLTGTGTIALKDSFNCASATDNGTGDYSATFVNALGNSNYCVTFSAGGNLPTNGSRAIIHKTYATGSHRGSCQWQGDGSILDTDNYNVAVQGDLA